VIGTIDDLDQVKMMSPLTIFTYRVLAFRDENQPGVVYNFLGIPSPTVGGNQQVKG
jgi:hypothetical protein